MQSIQAEIGDVVAASTLELFAAYGVELYTPQDPDREAAVAFAAVIGFTGEALRGTLLLAPECAVLERTQQVAGSSNRDWVGELANQLLGRVKNHLLRYGVEIHVTIPLVLRGERIAPSARGEIVPHVYDAAPGDVRVWFDFE